jgi:hypothetical protein
MRAFRVSRWFVEQDGDAGARRRRRALAAGIFGAGLFVAGAMITIGDFASAIGGYTPAKPIEITPAPFPSSDDPPVERRRKARSSYARAVCVRLCDGYFFPTSSTAGGDETCQSQCPDAPVAMYSQPGDAIEDAVSLIGERYADLPVALRHRTTYDSACVCHGSLNRSRVAELRDDPTLRKGDIVMTGNGFRVYEGAGGGATAGDFVAVTQAPNLPKGSREALIAMEHAGIGGAQVAIEETPPAARISALQPPPRLKGVLTVEGGRRGAPAR